MRRLLQIDSHSAFQWAAARAVLAGGLLALVGHRLAGPWLEPGGGPPGPAWLLGVLLLGAALVPPRGLRQGAGWLLLGIIGAGGAWLEGRAPLFGAAVQALALGGWVGAGGPPLPRWQQLATAAAAALLLFGARRVPVALLALDEVALLPGALGPVLAGMGVGLVVSSAALLRRLRVVTDPVDAELRGLLPAAGAEDEIGRLVRQAFATYEEVAGTLRDQPQALAAAEDLVKRIARFGRRWREIEEQVGRTDRAGLAARRADLEARRAATTDEQARAEYERAQVSVQAQLAYLEEIGAGRERAVARLHNQVATLERVRLAALRHRSVDAGKLGEELRAAVEELGRAGQELDVAAEALAEAPV